MELKKYKLGDICDIIAGGDAPLNVTPEKTETNIIPVYSNGIVEEGLYGYTDKARIITKAFTVSARGTIGVSFLRNQPFFPIVRLLSVIPNSNEVDLDYLYYYSKLLRFEKDGSVQQQLTVPMLSNIEVRLLPYSTQCKVASILSTLDHKIALNRAINRNLEALAKQLYDYWFVQFDFPDENGRPYKSSGGKMVWNEVLKREVPEGWENGVFSDIANITMGQSPDGSSYNKQGEGIVFYQGSTDFGIRFPSVRMYTTSPSRYAKQGDILMSVRAPVGAVNIANSDCCIGRGLSAINSKKESITYIYYVIHYLKVRFDSLNTAGTTFGSITKDELFSLPVVIPSEKILERFEAICKPIFNKQMEIGFEIESLTLQRDELLPLLMNGQVTIE